MSGLLKAMWNDESGQGLVEYALIIALVSVALIVALQLMAGKLSNIFGRIGDELDKAPGNT